MLAHSVEFVISKKSDHWFHSLKDQRFPRLIYVPSCPLSRVQCILQVSIWCEFLGNSVFFAGFSSWGGFFSLSVCVCVCLSLVTLVGFLLISFCAKFISIASRLPNTIHNKYLYTHQIYCLFSLKNLFCFVHSFVRVVCVLQYAVI